MGEEGAEVAADAGRAAEFSPSLIKYLFLSFFSQIRIYTCECRLVIMFWSITRFCNVGDYGVYYLD